MATPEATSAPAVEKTLSPESQEILEGLSVDKIALHRLQQRYAYNEARQAIDDAGGTVAEMQAAGNFALKEADRVFLKSLIDSEVGQGNIDAVQAVIEKYSMMNMSHADWQFGKPEADEDGEAYLSGQDQLAADLDALKGVLSGDAETQPAIPMDPEKAAKLYELNTLRDTLAELTAKRQGRLGTIRGGGEKYQEALEAYNTRVQEVGRETLEDQLADDTLSDEEKQKLVVEYLFDEQKKLREETLEKVKGTKVHKVINWLNKGHWSVRVLKGAAVGVGAGLVGAGVGALAGVAGAATIGAGVAATVTAGARFARGFAASDGRQGRGMDTHENDKWHKIGAGTAISTKESGDAFDAAHGYFADKYERDTRAEQGKRRKSVIAGMAGVALGAGAVMGIHTAVDSGIFDGWGNRNLSPGVSAQGHEYGSSTEIGNADGSTTNGTADLPFETHHESNVHIPDHPESGSQDGGFDHVFDDTEQDAEENPEVTPEPDPNFYVEPGEGGIHLFQDMGLTEKDWYSVANELRSEFPGQFYMYGNDVRISHPGQLPIEVQEFVKGKFGLAA